MAGRLIVFEGTDGSGKSTQFHLACQALKAAGREFRTCVYPQYQEESSALIRMYLGGKFGTHPSDVNAYAASTFFAVDRYAGYKQEWGAYYEAGGLMVMDRYTTSNAVHQASKLPEGEQKPYLDWLFDFEYRLMGLPAPDLVLYLDVPTELSAALRRLREEKTGTHADIHEADESYLRRCRESGRRVADYAGWKRVDCAAEGRMRPPEEIHEEIWRLVSPLL